MKRATKLFVVIFIFLLSSNVNAQTKTGANYFTGKWNVMVKGLPDGDTKMFVNLEKKDSTFGGHINDSTGKKIADFSKVDMMDTTVTVYFTAQNYDVYLRLNKKDDDHVTGTMLDMFDAEGERVKE